jgi:heme/copper-type cytochrome/quinol oxidase subunit 2
VVGVLVLGSTALSLITRRYVVIVVIMVVVVVVVLLVLVLIVMIVVVALVAGHRYGEKRWGRKRK